MVYASRGATVTSRVPQAPTETIARLWLHLAACLVMYEGPSRGQPTHSMCDGDAGPSRMARAPAHGSQVS